MRTARRATLAVILATKDARNNIADIEEAPDEEIEREKISVLRKMPKKMPMQKGREKTDY